MRLQNFDFVAPFYPLLERAAFGDSLNEARLAFLDSIAAGERILLIGEGNGRFLSALLRRRSVGQVTVVDSSGRMLASLLKRIQPIRQRSALTLVYADFCDWTPAFDGFDVVVTHFFLDLFRPDSQSRLLAKMTQLAQSNAIWVDVDYVPQALTARTKCIEWLQYRFDRFFSGIEADRHYDPVGLIDGFGWSTQATELYCQGSVCARKLVKTSST